MFTPHGTRETHVMVTEFVQPKLDNKELHFNFIVPRQKKALLNEVKLSELFRIEFHHYTNSKRNISLRIQALQSASYDIVKRTYCSLTSALENDHIWLKSIMSGSETFIGQVL